MYCATAAMKCWGVVKEVNRSAKMVDGREVGLVGPFCLTPFLAGDSTPTPAFSRVATYMEMQSQGYVWLGLGVVYSEENGDIELCCHRSECRMNH